MPGVNVNVRNNDGSMEFVGTYYGNVNLSDNRGTLRFMEVIEPPEYADPLSLPTWKNSTHKLLAFETVTKSIEVTDDDLIKAMWMKENALRDFGIHESARSTHNNDRHSTIYVWKEILIKAEDYDKFFELAEFDPDDSVIDKSEHYFDHYYL